MSTSPERSQILEMIENNTISAEEGLQLLQALETSQVGHESSIPGVKPGPEDEETPILKEALPDPEDLLKWKRWWIIPLLIGMAIMLLGGGLMYAAWNAHRFGVLFLLTWIPFLLGTALVALAWGSRHSPWIHIRIQQKPGERPRKIAFSFPIPLRVSAWALRTFGHWIPNLDATGLDEVLIALKDSANENTPLVINVDEGEHGEKVKVIIG
ncbi:MAG: hypothetical protein KGY39_01795 [Anaerolineales bacterium]|nr:hypothetical protein [Anaerolineales bacterium]MBS3752454.1 hypothetical protein [Anaerolineales bacterium]